MSYNIDTFKIKELKDFKLPIASLYKHERKDWHPERTNLDDGEVLFESGESFLKGVLKDGVLHVNEFACYGEGSGYFMNTILKPAFKESTGVLEAVCIWEGGDSITRLEVEDGVVKETGVEL